MSGTIFMTTLEKVTIEITPCVKPT
uniref:Transposase n=1 Tax=Heterorhabditis bacteriophora TaxID=37862 RepID=A0A1I7WLI0_HETBA